VRRGACCPPPPPPRGRVAAPRTSPSPLRPRLALGRRRASSSHLADRAVAPREPGASPTAFIAVTKGSGAAQRLTAPSPEFGAGHGSARLLGSAARVLIRRTQASPGCLQLPPPPPPPPPLLVQWRPPWRPPLPLPPPSCVVAGLAMEDGECRSVLPPSPNLFSYGRRSADSAGCSWDGRSTSNWCVPVVPKYNMLHPKDTGRGGAAAAQRGPEAGRDEDNHRPRHNLLALCSPNVHAARLSVAANAEKCDPTPTPPQTIYTWGFQLILVFL